MRLSLQTLLLAVFLVVIGGSLSYVNGEELYTIQSSEVEEIADHLSMEGHSEHELVTCSTKHRYYREIAEMLNEGYTEEEILNYYEEMYGEQGFREPKQSGFSLLAWTAPFLMLGAGIIIFIFKIKKQVSTQGESEGTVDSENKNNHSAEDKVIRAIIEEEKRKYF